MLQLFLDFFFILPLFCLTIGWQVFGLFGKNIEQKGDTTLKEKGNDKIKKKSYMRRKIKNEK